MSKRDRKDGRGWALLLVALAALGAAGCGPKDPWPSAVRKAERLLATLTLDQKLALLVGQSRPTGDAHRSAGYLPAVTSDTATRVPAQYLCDGPNGVGNGNTGVTQFPTGIALAASWDVDLARRYGAAAGEEWRRKGCHYALAPGMNIIRLPYGGRSAEYYSEDPFLAGRIATAAVQGIQSQGVIATVKHYAANNQEIARSSVDVVATERTLREIYLPAFEAAITEGHAGAVMCSYNRVNGAYACEDPWLLKTVLRDDWGFQGLVMTDWGAAHGTVSGVKGGLELEMGSSQYFTPTALKAALADGSITEADIDRMVLHQLSALFMADGIDKVPAQPDAGDVSHADLALELARSGTVLLKNAGGALPLDPADTGLRIAVIGGAADAYAQTGMPGSGFVNPSAAVVTALQGIEQRLGRAVTYARGSLGTGRLPILAAADDTFGYFDWNTFTFGTVTLPRNATVTTAEGGDTAGFTVQYLDAAGSPLDGLDGVVPDVARGTDTLFPMYSYYHPWPSGLPTVFTAVFRGYLALAADEAGKHAFNLTARGRAQLSIDGAVVGTVDERWLDASTTFPAVDLAAGTHLLEVRLDSADWTWAPGTFGPRTPAVTLGWEPDELDAAVSAAAASDVAIVVVSDRESEETDHPATLPGNQDELVARVAAVAPRTIVVVNSGSGLVLPWADGVDAILEGWYGGQRSGDALAGILFGDVNPSGRTVVTFPVSMAQWYAQQPSQFPGQALDGAANLTASYDEGVLVGYRWFDERQLAPRFPFGHGLSYTQFTYGDPRLSAPRGDGASVDVSVKVRNTGARAGSEVVQLYLGFPSPAGEPPRQLKGFSKVSLAPGAAAVAAFHLDRRSFAYWDEASAGWVVPRGQFQIMVGSSSRDIRKVASYTVTGP
jgi:beta-glucosidase